MTWYTRGEGDKILLPPEQQSMDWPRGQNRVYIEYFRNQSYFFIRIFLSAILGIAFRRRGTIPNTDPRWLPLQHDPTLWILVAHPSREFVHPTFSNSVVRKVYGQCPLRTGPYLIHLGFLGATKCCDLVNQRAQLQPARSPFHLR